MDKEYYVSQHGPVFLLLLMFLAGCAQSVSRPSGDGSLGEGTSKMQRSARAIIYFEHPTSATQELSAAIADACHCQPGFFRPYLGDALIYMVELPPGRTFSDFQRALMQNGEKFGIKAVEQDGVVQHQ